MAVADPVRTPLETITAAIVAGLTEDERQRFTNEVNDSLRTFQTDSDLDRLVDVFIAWYRLVVARRDPKYRQNMDRGTKDRGETVDLRQLRSRYKL